MGKFGEQLKKQLSRQRHEFLLTFFDPTPIFAEKEVNGYILQKHINGNTGNWEVNIYTKESYAKVKEHQKLFNDEKWRNSLNQAKPFDK